MQEELFGPEEYRQVIAYHYPERARPGETREDGGCLPGPESGEDCVQEARGLCLPLLTRAPVRCRHALCRITG